MEGTLALIIGFVAGAAIGGAIAWLLAGRRTDSGVDRLTAEALRLAFVEETSKARTEMLTEQSRLNDEVRRSEEALRKAESDREREAVRNLVAPVEQRLKEVGKRIEDLDKATGTSRTEITSMVTSLARKADSLEAATVRLGSALSNQQVRGGWGETQLKRLVEAAGMAEHLQDFRTQVPTDDKEDQSRPDMAIAVPGGLRIIVDSKVPLDALRKAFETDDEQERSTHLKAHAEALRTQVLNLSRKDYPSKIDDSLDFVLLFVPGDHWLDLALSQRPELLEEAISKRVILTSPSSFFAVLLAVAHTWKQQRLADNAMEIQQESSNLYKRLRTVIVHIEKIGDGITKAGKAYNEAIASIDRNLITSAERIDALGGSDGRGAIEPPDAAEIDLIESRKRDQLPSGNGDGPGNDRLPSGEDDNLPKANTPDGDPPSGDTVPA